MDKMLCSLSERGASREVIARSLTLSTERLVTKNAVCGRAFRLGVVSLRRQEKTPSKIPEKIAVKKNTYYNPPPPKGAFLLTKGDAGGCLYMEGDARDRNFCGLPTVRRSPLGSGCWCESHYKVVFQVDRRAA